MWTLVISLIINFICYGVTYMMLPQMNALEFVIMVVLVPAICNVLILCKGHLIINSKAVTIAILVVITTIAYILFGIFSLMAGRIQTFANNNSYYDENVMVSINENINSVSNIVFVLLIQLGFMFLTKYLSEKNKKSNEV